MNVDKQTKLVQDKQAKLVKALQLMNESLSTSQTKFVKLFPTLLELSQNYNAESFVPQIEDIAALRTPTALSVKISSM